MSLHVEVSWAMAKDRYKHWPYWRLAWLPVVLPDTPRLIRILSLDDFMFLWEVAVIQTRVSRNHSQHWMPEKKWSKAQGGLLIWHFFPSSRPTPTSTSNPDVTSCYMDLCPLNVSVLPRDSPRSEGWSRGVITSWSQMPFRWRGHSPAWDLSGFLWAQTVLHRRPKDM